MNYFTVLFFVFLAIPHNLEFQCINFIIKYKAFNFQDVVKISLLKIKKQIIILTNLYGAIILIKINHLTTILIITVYFCFIIKTINFVIIIIIYVIIAIFIITIIISIIIIIITIIIDIIIIVMIIIIINTIILLPHVIIEVIKSA
jgi:hypothetical protein